MSHSKLMQWRRESSGNLILYVDVTETGANGVRYNEHSLAIPDYKEHNGSPGYATMQNLLKLNYKFVPTPQED